ncbi:MAG: hypothetical protein N5837_04110 [Lactobacillus crispatus]|nr:hypothetical protein [Lactobacillus crispatus]
MLEIKEIKSLPTFDSWAITDSFWGIIKESFKDYNDALDNYEDENDYENNDIELSYILSNPQDQDDYFVKPAPLIY